MNILDKCMEPAARQLRWGGGEEGLSISQLGCSSSNEYCTVLVIGTPITDHSDTCF